MGDNQTSNCSAGASAFDPDIEGIGGIVYFAVTALTAIFSVLSADLMGSLPGVRHNEIDFLLIDFIRKWTSWGPRNTDTNKALEQGRKYETCFEKLLIPLADQQLITSLALIIAAFIKWYENSLYSLEMAWTLATISLVTHMATIRYCPKCFRRYLRQHRLLGAARSTAVFLVLGGFICLMMILEYAQFEAFQLAEGLDDQSSAAFAWQLKPACILTKDSQPPPELLIDIFWAIAALTYYVNILTKLYSPRGRLHGSSFVYRAIIRLLGSKPAKFDDYRSLHKSRMKWASNRQIRPLRSLCECLADFEAAYVAFKMSVSADMPWLLFVLIYFLAQLKTVWLDSNSPFWGNAADSPGFGFGQLVALILLAVPALSGLEAFLGPKQAMAPWSEHVEVDPGNELALSRISQSLSMPIEETTEILSSGYHKGDSCNMSVLDHPRRIETMVYAEDADTQAIISRRGFRRCLYFFLFWNMAVLIYAAVITGGPLDGEWINVSAIASVASLFTWEIVLEGFDLLQVGSKGLLQLATRAAQIGHHKVRIYGPISHVIEQQSIPHQIYMEFPDSSLGL